MPGAISVRFGQQGHARGVGNGNASMFTLPAPARCAGMRSKIIGCPIVKPTVREITGNAAAGTGNGLVPPPPPPSPGMRPREQLRADPAKEQSRTYRRTVYDFDYWANHRSTDRYLFNLLSMPSSRIIRSLAAPVIVVASIALGVGVNHELVAQGTIPAFLEFPNVSPEPINLTAFALSLLLVFRTNSSYGRFDEARKMWGLMLNRTRDICRMAISYFPDEDLDGKATFARWTVAFTLALKCHLRPNTNLREEVKDLLSPAETDLLMSADHKVLMALQVMSELIESADVTEFHKLQMHQNLTTFEDILGGCERLLRTPIPLSYTRHTSRFLLIWLMALPLCLWAKIGWGVVPCSSLIALLLLGIEEIGVEIEEPFGILALESISGRSRIDLTELINKQASVKTYLMRNAGAGMNDRTFDVKGAIKEIPVDFRETNQVGRGPCTRNKKWNAIVFIAIVPQLCQEVFNF